MCAICSMAAGSVEGLIAGVGAMRVDEFVKTFSEIKPDVNYSIKKLDNTYMRIGLIGKKGDSYKNREGLPVAVYKNTSNGAEYVMSQNYPDGHEVNAERGPARVYVNDGATGEYIGRLTISTGGGRRKSRHRRSKKNRRTKRRKA